MLFGHITKNNPRTAERFTVNTSTSPNIMTLLPAVPRFKLLPILEPTDENDFEPTEQFPLSVPPQIQEKHVNPDASSITGLALPSSIWTFGGLFSQEKVDETSKKLSWFT